MIRSEQVTRTGNIVIDYDQKLSDKEINDLMLDLFNPVLRKDGRQYILYEKIGILACNVTYLGTPHPLYKKRIQLKSYYPDYLTKNNRNRLKTLYLGIYTYKKTRLFVVFETDTYAGKKSHNSSAHVYSVNLQYAQKAGKFDKVDAFGNHIKIFNTYEFVRYIKTLGGEMLGGTTGEDIIELINNRFSEFKKEIPSVWNGIDSYKELAEDKGKPLRQDKWQGFYFELLFKKFLNNKGIDDLSIYQDKKKNGIDLDFIFNNFDWTFGDLKAEQIDEDILGNAYDSFDNVIKEHNGVVYYVVCLIESEKDSQHDYQVTRYWNTLRDDPYTTEEEMRERIGKTMKYSVSPKKLCVLKIDKVAYEILKKTPFAQGINSNGKARPPKLKVKKDMIDALSVFSVNFD